MNIALFKEFFMWCTVINLGVFMLSAVMCICARGFIHRVHGKMFGLKPEQIDQILYGLLAFYKIMFITFILVPWIALVIMT